MFDNAADHDDDRLADLLCHYEQLLTAGTVTTSADDSVCEEDPALAKRLQAAQRGVAALDRARRRYLQHPSSTGGKAGSETLTQGTVERLAENTTNIGRFRIKRELGHGGLGVVFLAYDPGARRQVALKIPRPETLANTDIQLRFLREAEAAARLSHPHITSVFEVGQAGPICFLASEFCSGPTLRQWLDEHPGEVSMEVAAGWLQQLASAVNHAHSRGVLHRDIKPSNVMLVRDEHEDTSMSADATGASWSPKLTDFGMAKLLEMNQESRHRTQTGTLIGTLPYMAPEQAEGRTGDIDVRTDIYGLGALLYELLAGRPPAQGATDADTLRQVLFAETVPPSRIRGAVPKDLEAICLKCLAREPKRRYATAHELELDLERYLAGRPIDARPPTTFKRFGMWCRRRPALAVLAAACCVSLMVLVGLVSWHNDQLQQHYRVERQLRIEAQQHRDEAKSSAEQAIAAQQETQQHLYISKLWRAHEAWKADSMHSYFALLGELQTLETESTRNTFARRYCDRLARSEVMSFHAGGSKLFAVTFVNESTVATGEEAGSICLWDRSTGKMIQRLEGHSSCVNSISVSSDGQRLASASCDGTIGIWHLATGELRERLTSPRGPVGHVDFMGADGDLVSYGIDHSICTWNCRGKEWSRPIVEASDSLGAAVVNADTTWSAQVIRTDQSDRSIAWWQTSNGQSSGRIQAFESRPQQLGFNHAGKLLALAEENGQLWMWSPEKATMGVPVVLQSGPTSLEFSHDDRVLAVAGSDLVLRLIDIESRQIIAKLKGIRSKVTDIAFSPSDREVAVATEFDGVHIWRVDSNPNFSRHHLSIDRGSTAVLSSSGKWVAVGHRYGGLRLTQLTPEHESYVLEKPPGSTEIQSINFSRDSMYLMVVTNRGFRAWELSSGHPTLSFDRPELFAHDIAKSHGIRTLSEHPREPTNLIGHAELVVKPVDGEEVLHRFPTIEDFLTLQFAPNAEHLFVGTFSSGNYLWNLSNDRVQEVSGHGFGWAKDARINPAGDFVAIAYADHVVLYSMTDGGTHAILHDQGGFTGALAFSPDGRTLATGSHDSRIRLWHVGFGEEMLALDDGNQMSLSLSFSEDGQMLYSVGLDENHNGSVLAWPTE